METMNPEIASGPRVRSKRKIVGRSPTEHAVQSQILEWLKHKHIFAWRNNSGGFGGSHKGKRWFVKFGKKGSPDIFAVIKGKIFGIEVKSGEGFQSQTQLEFQVEFERAGGKYILARRLEDVEAEFGARAHSFE